MCYRPLCVEFMHPTMKDVHIQYALRHTPRKWPSPGCSRWGIRSPTLSRHPSTGRRYWCGGTGWQRPSSHPPSATNCSKGLGPIPPSMLHPSTRTYLPCNLLRWRRGKHPGEGSGCFLICPEWGVSVVPGEDSCQRDLIHHHYTSSEHGTSRLLLQWPQLPDCQPLRYRSMIYLRFNLHQTSLLLSSKPGITLSDRMLSPYKSVSGTTTQWSSTFDRTHIQALNWEQSWRDNYPVKFNFWQNSYPSS